jgi:hypothetical protein
MKPITCPPPFQESDAALKPNEYISICEIVGINES